MQLSRNASKHILLLLTLPILSIVSSAQVKYAGNSVDLTVSGTSTLHDWNMKSVKAECVAAFVLTNTGQIAGVSSLVFTTPASGLKSDHTAMDNNAYKALKTDKNPSISYTMTSVTVSPAGNGAATVTCNGKLCIAGTTRDESITAVCKANPDNTITVTGSQKISMKDFQITPPSFMLGAVKTGNDVVLNFTLVLKRS